MGLTHFIKNKYVILAKEKSQKMRQQTYYYLLLFFLLTFSGCLDFKSKDFNEGTIEYSIQIEDEAQPSFNSSLLPNKIIVKFRNNNTSNKVEGLSGAVTLTYINNVDDKNCLILVKFLNKKLFFEEPMTSGNISTTYSGMPNITIKETNDSIVYQGYKCKKAIASFNDSSNYSFEILYTNDIKIVNPNANTPFESINGVMLKFKVKLYKHTMSITATTIKREHISMDNFTTPSDYVRVSKKTIEDFLSLLQ